MRQHYSKHAEIDKSIRNHELNHQRSRREKSRRSRRDSNDNVKRNAHLKKISRLRKHVSMISMSANAATYHDDDENDVDIAMSFTLAHELTCTFTTLQRKKLIS